KGENEGAQPDEHSQAMRAIERITSRGFVRKKGMSKFADNFKSPSSNDPSDASDAPQKTSKTVAKPAEKASMRSTATTGSDSKVDQIREARAKGYEGDACGDCGNFTLVRNGTCMKCVTCGGTSGCS
ncbi:MAG: vitamin B12-dependent ribonucleotide reductase, partial [Alphaproteobacteria bacterium]|nr:vitamin B12-dependent ribonucleotide reductase [Alphaproteobacteria bacterium]